MFIQATDKKLYEDPIIYGTDFFIQAIGIEAPEIVIKYSPTSTLTSSRKLAYKKLGDLGIKAKLASEGDEDVFAFPPKWSGLLSGAKWNLQFTDMIPVPQNYKSKIDYPSANARFLAWEMEFPMQVVVDFLDHEKLSVILSNFLLGYNAIPPLDRKTAQKLKRSLEQQVKSATASHVINLVRMDQ